ncbi:hypothetical protein AAHC03_010304 [Spirometra sp. Aus1]|nr:unnamed protein product [Spirometra erinaceieuropaei]
MPYRRAEVKTTDMSESMQQYAVESAAEAMHGRTDNRQIAGYIRRCMQERYSGNWQCIVGSNFGSEVTHGKHGLIFFRLGGNGILLFRTV